MADEQEDNNKAEIEETDISSNAESQDETDFTPLGNNPAILIYKEWPDGHKIKIQINGKNNNTLNEIMDYSIFLLDHQTRIKPENGDKKKIKLEYSG